MSWHLKNLTSLCFQKILSTQIRFILKKVAVYCKLGVASIQAVSLSQKSSHIEKSSSKTSRSVVSQTTQLGAGAFQLMVVHYVASLFILESTRAKGENQIWHLWICACKTLVDGNHKQIIKRLKLGCKRLIFTELVVFCPPLFDRTEIPFQRTCKDSGATLLPQTAQGCFAKENGPQSARVIEKLRKISISNSRIVYVVFFQVF